MNWSKAFFTWLLIVTAMPMWAQVQLATVFSDNMVLQRELPVPIWGKAAPGENVTVTFAGQTLQCQADSAGRWMVKLSPMQANAQAQTITVCGAENTLEVKNVLIGEVWLASGQSNMEMPLWTDRPRWRAIDGDKHAAAGANNLIRITTFKKYLWDQLPDENYPLQWEELNATNALSFSATGFYFAQELFKELNVPIGIVASHWGGTRIEPWTPPEGFNSIAEVSDIAYRVNAKLPDTEIYKKASAESAAAFETWLKEFNAAAAAGKILPPPPEYPSELRPYENCQQPTVIYNRMIYPLLPFAFRGAIWYQGCSNIDDGMLYRYKMQALLNGWRELFERPDLAFYFVQLAPYRYTGRPETRLPELWEAQQAFAEVNGDNVAMAVINDVGDYDDVHPHDKLTVGRRLAWLALRHTYNQRERKADSPVMTAWCVENNKIIIDFKNVESWKFNGNIDDFEVAGAAGVWQRARVECDGNKLIVSAEAVKNPVALRYMWNQTLTGKLFNEAGLPLGAFRCGRVPEKREVIADLEENFQLIYQLDPRHPLDHKEPVKYQIDNSDNCQGKLKRIAYWLELTGQDGKEQWVAVVMDAFTGDIKKIGVPVASAEIFFARKVNNLHVVSNVSGLITGDIDMGNIEFWSGNYTQKNGYKVAGANGRMFDFGDDAGGYGFGYGSMQVHNFKAGQTIFAYNNFTAKQCDLGIGNAPTGHPDWTFHKNGTSYSNASLRIYVSFE